MFPIQFIHGTKDHIAPVATAVKMAHKWGAGITLLPAAHFVTRESASQVTDIM